MYISRIPDNIPKSFGFLLFILIISSVKVCLLYKDAEIQNFAVCEPGYVLVGDNCEPYRDKCDKDWEPK